MTNRRDFIKSMGALGSVSLGSSLVYSDNSISSDDYKATVVVELLGGNDAFNMVFPTDTNDAGTGGYDQYKEARGSLAVNRTLLDHNGINPYASSSEDSDNSDVYLKGYYDVGANTGINGVMPELAKLMRSGHAKAIANVGTMISPLNKTTLSDKTAERPLFLFAHNHQSNQMRIGRSDVVDDFGWAGKIADLWSEKALFQDTSGLGLNVSLAGNSQLLSGEKTRPFVIQPSGPSQFDQYSILSQYGDARKAQIYDRRSMFGKLSGGVDINKDTEFPNPNGRFTPADFSASGNYRPSSPLKQVYQSLMNRSFNTLEETNKFWDQDTGFTTQNSYGKTIDDSDYTEEELGMELSNRFGSLIQQFAGVAKMIKVSQGKASRQVFSIKMGGFDTHSSQSDSHPILLRELSLALEAFHNALSDVGLADHVTTATTTDFGRTLSNNGDGTDHGWAGHNLIMGGSLNNTTPALYGAFPELSLGSDDDFSDKGRIIPSIAQEQISGSIAKWFGVSDSDMPSIFPNLGNFATTSGDISSAYLDELFLS